MTVNVTPSASASAFHCLPVSYLYSLFSENCAAQASSSSVSVTQFKPTAPPAVYPCCLSFHSCLSSCMTSSSLRQRVQTPAPTSCYGAPGCARCGGCMPLAGRTCRGRSCGACCTQQVRGSGACLGLLVGLHAHDDSLLQRAAGSAAAESAPMVGGRLPHRQYTHRVMTVWYMGFSWFVS